MILTGPQIADEVDATRITIDPFDPSNIEPNSYGFHLGSELLTYDGLVLDAHLPPPERVSSLPRGGRVLLPDRLYLAQTLEVLGSPWYAATLYACRSVATLGVWITYSAPLGHTGAVVCWTLEIRVAHPVVLYQGMRIGKIAFWAPQGALSSYEGKYSGSRRPLASRLASETPAPPDRAGFQ